MKNGLFAVSAGLILNGGLVFEMVSTGQWITVEPGIFMMGAEPGPDVLKPLPRDTSVTSKKPGAPDLHTGIDSYQGAHWDERPVHEVTISNPFELSRLITLGEFLRYKPEHAEVYAFYGMEMDPKDPVTRVTWDEAQGYCQWLGKTENLIYRLPTEAEWEYAAAKGHIDSLGEGTSEWCYDWWGRYQDGAVIDPLGPADGTVRIIRGRVDDLGRTRITDRTGGLPGERLPMVSFRTARVVDKVGTFRSVKPPAAVFQEVNQQPKEWTPVDPDTPIFHGGQEYIDKWRQSNFDAAELPYWGRHHVPSVTFCNNGDILVTAFTGPNDSSDQNAVLITRLRDGADQFDPPACFFILPDRDAISATLHTAENGDLYHFNYMGFEDRGLLVRRVSRDNGATWSRPEIVRFHFSGESDDGFQARLQRLQLDTIKLADGSIAMPRDVLGFNPLGTALFKSVDEGKSWHEMTRMGWQSADFGKNGRFAGWIAGMHAPIAELRDGSFMAIGRRGDIEGRAPLSRSTDGGRTWTYGPSDFTPISFSQQPLLKRLAEGPLMIVYYTDSTAKRGNEDGIEIVDAGGNTRSIVGTFIALSFDEGESWAHHKLLPLDAGKPYNSSLTGMHSAVQSPDGMIHLVSSSRYWRFNLAWIMEPMPGE